MKNCITTKLKETVTGSGFFKAGELVFKLVSTENTWLFWLSQYNAVTTATLEGGAYFVSQEGSTVSIGATINVDGDGVNIFVPKGTHFLKISDKSKITSLGSFNFQNWTSQNFIHATSSSFKIELYGQTLRYAKNISIIILDQSFYRFYELDSIFNNKTITKAVITAEDVLIGTMEDLFSEAGVITSLELGNQGLLTGKSSVFQGKQIRDFISNNNVFDVNFDDLYSIEGNSLTIINHKGKITGNPLNLNNEIAFVSLVGSNDVSLSNDNLFVNRSNIISGERLKFTTAGDVDNFLITNATKAAYPNLSGFPAWYKSIQIVGTRTSASDAAVANLVSKGYTVTLIN